jgi:hypothetical protein
MNKSKTHKPAHGGFSHPQRTDDALEELLRRSEYRIKAMGLTPNRFAELSKPDRLSASGYEFNTFAGFRFHRKYVSGSLGIVLQSRKVEPPLNDKREKTVDTTHQNHVFQVVFVEFPWEEVSQYVEWKKKFKVWANVMHGGMVPGCDYKHPKGHPKGNSDLKRMLMGVGFTESIVSRFILQAGYRIREASRVYAGLLGWNESKEGAEERQKSLSDLFTIAGPATECRNDILLHVMKIWISMTPAERSRARISFELDESCENRVLKIYLDESSGGMSKGRYSLYVEFEWPDQHKDLSL